MKINNKQLEYDHNDIVDRSMIFGAERTFIFYKYLSISYKSAKFEILIETRFELKKDKTIKDYFTNFKLVIYLNITYKSNITYK